MNKTKTQKNTLLEEDKYVYMGDPVLGVKFSKNSRKQKKGKLIGLIVLWYQTDINFYLY